MKSKQRDEVRRLKLDAQQQLGEDGGVVDNGYYHEVPTNRSNDNDGMRGSIEYNNAMSALEEEMSGDFYTTDESTDNQNSNTTLKHDNPHHHDSSKSSLTHHINTIRNLSSSSQPQHSVVPTHLNDNTDNRSTTSTMSDLSMTESKANVNSITSLNSLLNGKPVPVDSPSLSSRKNAFFQQPSQQHRQHQNTGNGGRIGANGSEDPKNISSNVNSFGIRNATKNNKLLSSESPSNNANQTHTASITGFNKGRRLQTPEFNRYSANRNNDSNSNTRKTSTDNSVLSNKIALLVDACETIRFPFKKKLMLNGLHMTAADIPVKDLYQTSLGQSLYKLSLSGNRLSTIPRKLVTCLSSLKSMDISQCELHQLPERWNLPQLRRLNLSHNRLSDFPEEVSLFKSGVSGWNIVHKTVRGY